MAAAQHTDDKMAEKGMIHEDDKASGSLRASTTEGVAFAREHAADVRKLFLKLDLVILPFAILLYLSAYLDRGKRSA